MATLALFLSKYFVEFVSVALENTTLQATPS